VVGDQDGGDALAGHVASLFHPASVCRAPRPPRKADFAVKAIAARQAGDEHRKWVQTQLSRSLRGTPMRTIRLRMILGVGAAALLSSAAFADPAPLLGFSPKASDAERAAEAAFDKNLSKAAIRDRLKLMAAEPNNVGSPHDKALADYTLQKFKEWGWDAHIEVFDVLYPTPKTELLELMGPNGFKATLTEKPVAGDKTSEHTEGELPAYLAYQGDGDVTAPIVYVNYGMPADYEALARMGVDVKGKIVIVRYGGGWRGLKPKLAQEHGAVGCIIYSDPADDGYGDDLTYPDGPSRPPQGIQRGSVLDMPIEPGDPLTPGYGAVKGAKRIAREGNPLIMRIPALPISYGDAQRLLAAIGGPSAPRGWRGQLPITYRVGQSAEPVHLVVQSNWDQKPLYDVIAVMKGSEAPDQWVVRGNHHDGWVFGANDPLSGNTALMEEAKSLGALHKAGWSPKRTIVYASWDGEEIGLMGSTEWAEQHGDELKKKALLYINSDSNGRGFLNAVASYSTSALINEVAGDVTDPETGVSVKAREVGAVQAEAAEAGASPMIKARAKTAAEGRIGLGDLGSGSDYTPFVQHLGVTTIDVGYGGEGDDGGVYHSAYDTFEHYDRFGDPGMVYGVTMAQTIGRLVMRAADADVAPLRFGNLAATVSAETSELRALTGRMREQTALTNKLLDAKAFDLAADPKKANVPPPREAAPPALDFAPLEAAVAKLTASAKAYDEAAARGTELSAAKRAKLNTILSQVEHSLTDGRGLPGRPWYRHLIYAPGVLTGYGAKTLPGVREAIEGRRWSEAGEFIGRTADVLKAASAKIDEATALVKG
jgi:N-acetylated-alpha-linked acidic dipeptidase